MGEVEVDEVALQLAAQTEALDKFGFDPAFDVGDSGPLGLLFGVKQAATCRLCGAMVRTNAVVVHHKWHYPPAPLTAEGRAEEGEHE